MGDDGGDCGGGGGDSGGGDSGCGGGDYGGNDGGCNSSHGVDTSHHDSSHSHTNDDHSSHANIHHHHSSTSHCLPTYEEAVGTVHHASHNHNRHSADDQHQVNMLNSDHATVDVYDQQNNFDSTTNNFERRNQARSGGSRQKRRGPRKFITDILLIAFGLFVTGLVVLLPLIPW